MFYADGFDAGSEENTESCADILLPFCPDFIFKGAPNPGTIRILPSDNEPSIVRMTVFMALRI